MALSAVQNNSVVQTSAGRYTEITQQFTSDISLAGGTIRIAPSLYIDDTDTSAPSQYLYQATYASAVLTPTIPDRKNWEVELTVIDNFNFTVRFAFFALEDVGYLADNGYINADVLGATAQISSNIGLYVNVGTESILHKIPTQVNFARASTRLTFQSGGLQIEGFQAGQPLTVTYSSNRSVANNYYIGLIRTDQITNGGNFVDDLNMKYAFIDGNVNTVGAVPSACFTTATGFSNGSAIATIDGTCLAASATYRVFIVVQVLGNWVTYISDELNEATPQNPIVSPNTSSLITDTFGNTATTFCVTGLSSCTPLTIEWIIDRLDYSTKASALGLNDNLSQTLESLEAFVLDSLPQDENDIAGNAIYVTKITTTTEIKAQTIVNVSDNTAVKYVVFKAVINYGTYTDTLYQVYQLSYDAPQSTLAYTLTDPTATATDVICAEDTGLYTAAFAGVGAYKAYTSINGGQCVRNTALIPTENANDISIDQTQIPLNSQACVYLVESGASTAQPCQDCDQLLVDLQIFVTDNPNLMTAVVSTDRVVDMEILLVNQVNSSINHSFTLTGDFSSNNIAITAGANSWAYFITFIDGLCSYRIRGEVLGIVSNGMPLIASKQLTLNANEAPCTPIDVPLVCSNTSSLAYTCDENTQTVVFTWVDNFVDTVLSDVATYTSGGSTIPAPATVIGDSEGFISRTVTFTNGCVLNVEQPIMCASNATLNCLNSQDLQVVYENRELTITTTDSFTSAVASNLLEYSLDGGVSWITYPGMAVTTIGQSVLVRSNVVFSDQCPDINKEVGATNNQTSQLAFTRIEEVFTAPTGDSITVTKNGGVITSDPNLYGIWLNGILLTNTHEIQYTKVNGTFTFTKNGSSYDLTGKSLTVIWWAEVDVADLNRQKQQVFTPAVSSNCVTVTTGVVDDDISTYSAFVNGQNVDTFSAITFVKTGNTFCFFDDMAAPYELQNKTVTIQYFEVI